MKFKALYPAPKRDTIGPHPDLRPDPQRPDLLQGGGYYTCACGALTNFSIYVDGCCAMVCSEECYAKVLQPLPTEPLPEEALLAWLEKESA